MIRVLAAAARSIRIVMERKADMCPQVFSTGCYEEAASSIRSRCAELLSGEKMPSVCIVLGSGLGVLAESCSVLLEIPYEEIPHFPVSTVSGHDGKLIVADMDGVLVFLMKGRFHYYEGYDMAAVTFPYRVYSLLGVENLLLTNAAGGLSPAFVPGDLMMIDDHMSMFAESPLRGENLDFFGPRFPDQTQVYDRELRRLLKAVAADLEISLHSGVYAMMRGPQYETPAEIRALRVLGVDAVGMSTVPEAIVASHCGMRVLGLSCITNLASGISQEPLSHSEVMEVGQSASEKCVRLVKRFVARAFREDF